jgi:LysM repeat protein
MAQSGDSLWSIAKRFDLQPETILWGNEWLSSVGVLQIGDTLSILPTDGVLHTVKDGDTFETLRRVHGTPAQEIFEYFGNGFDLTQPPELTMGQQIIVPNGTSPIIWSEAEAPIVETMSTSSSKYPDLGTGYFVWPMGQPYLMTQEYWGGHPVIDINTYFRQPIFASDSGTVAFSGWNDTGYGNLVIIDHGHGYRTYYAHNSMHATITIPQDIRIEATYKQIRLWSVSFASMFGRDVYYYFPPLGYKGVIIFFHGSGGDVREWFDLGAEGRHFFDDVIAHG